MSDKKFASHADLEQKKVSFEKLSDNAWAGDRIGCCRTSRGTI